MYYNWTNEMQFKLLCTFINIRVQQDRYESSFPPQRTL
ncbi:hypothetical protein V1478_015482 [Vespula squamosa]|uniref:Uncharacterized protein n=1 Tax=Vespula squamosa TaxID=30214 RepID=A0ABD2A573_VESSQ